jgi:tRNA-intron endonuclease
VPKNVSCIGALAHASFLNLLGAQQGMTKIQGLLMQNRVLTESSDAAREVYHGARYGSLQPDGRIQLSLLEALHLVEKGKLEVLDGRSKPINTAALQKRANRFDKQFWIKYTVFRNLRDRGYLVKTALKFGADFRVYEPGIKPGEGHARWVVFPVHEAETLTWHDFAAKNRVAHTTKKHLLIAVVDDEGDVSYWEVGWLRP